MSYHSEMVINYAKFDVCISSSFGRVTAHAHMHVRLHVLTELCFICYFTITKCRDVASEKFHMKVNERAKLTLLDHVFGNGFHFVIFRGPSGLL